MMLELDGSYGEGGGQILRTGVGLAALTGQSIRFTNIRAGRRVPGMAAQHLTSVRAAAAVCRARLEGDELGATELIFSPQGRVRSGEYRFDVGAAREGGSAGAASLVLQTVATPLFMAEGPSEVVVEGGTHNPASPSFDYLRDVWLPALAPMGIKAKLALEAWGWFPLGRGRIRATVAGAGVRRLSALDLRERGALCAIRGRAVAAKLPDHIPTRMRERAHGLLSHLPCELDVRAEVAEAACPGAGIFLTAIYEKSLAGFSAIGRRGRGSEEVAEEAAMGLIAHHASAAALDHHLGDQLMAPAAFADGRSHFTVHRVTRHLRTNAWVIEQFGLAEIALEERADGTGLVTMTPTRGKQS
jgi:RNA 3'-terminal phosphate cyclase (ATP)